MEKEVYETKKDQSAMVEEWARLVRKTFGDGDAVRDATVKDPEDVRMVTDILYDGVNLLDVYYPASYDKETPVVVNVHGGAYVYGSKEIYRHYGLNMASQGCIFVNANYRLAPEFKFPAQLEDINHVLEWIVKNSAEYSLRPDNVFMAGDSAGAQMLSHFAAIYSNKDFAAQFDFRIPEEIKLKGVALNCGLYDLKKIANTPEGEEERPDDHLLMAAYLGEEGKKKTSQIDVLSNITANYPPAIVMTSYYDFLRDLAKPFYDLLKERGAECIYQFYGEEGQEYMGHVFHCNLNLEEAKICNKDQLDFFRRHV
ncbi:MAG: alpha/beta hydrolase [Eubacteriales bacterium]|nr:alpha/beta hydrolase [Eubacteriales bacterium]